MRGNKLRAPMRKCGFLLAPLILLKRKQKDMVRHLFLEEPKRSPEELFAMAEEAEKLAKIAIDNKLTVVRGYRRVGKSSLVRSMLNILFREKKCIPLYADIVKARTEEELANHIQKEFKKLRTYLGVKPHRYIKKFYKRLEEELMKVTAKKTTITGTIAPSPSISAGQTRSKELTQLKLWDLFRGVKKSAAQIKKPVVIVLDEVQNIIEVAQHDQNFQIRDFQELLRYLHGYPDVHLVLTGSHSRLIPIVLGKKDKEPFYGRYIVEREVSLFNETQAKEFLLKGFQQLNIKFEEKWAEDVVNALGGVVGVLATYGKKYKERLENIVGEPPKNLYFDVLKEVANEYEDAIKEDLKTFVRYTTEEGIEESLLFDVIKAVSTYKFENNLDPSFNQVKEYVDKFGSDGNVKQALDILKDYGIVDIIEDKVVLTNPCIAFNAGITPKVVEVSLSQKLGISAEVEVVKHPAVPTEEENIIYIGNKSVMGYVLATVTMFNNGFDKVVLKGRGRGISRAVDTAEVVRNKFLPDVKVKEIKTGTEEVIGENGEKLSVSSIEIVLERVNA